VETHSITEIPIINYFFLLWFFPAFSALPSCSTSFLLPAGSRLRHFPSPPMPPQTASQLIFSAANPLSCLIPPPSQLQPFLPLPNGRKADRPVSSGRSSRLLEISPLSSLVYIKGEWRVAPSSPLIGFDYICSDFSSLNINM
jgi:hypothetical protein